MRFDKATFIGIFGIIVMLVGGLLFLISIFTTTKIPSMQNLNTSVGTITNLEYKRPRSGPTKLIITTDKSPNNYLIIAAGYLPSYNGCRINSINIGDKVKIYYDPNGYDYSIGEQNAVWKIEKNNKEIITAENVKSSIRESNDDYNVIGIGLFFFGLILALVSKYFPYLLG